MTYYQVPWWAEVQVFLGFIMFYWIMVPVLYYTNVSHPLPFPPAYVLMNAYFSLGTWHTSPYLRMNPMTGLGRSTTLRES
jgi:hypothetical protein